jgi:tetratricopeptide (TPR) repeat protein
VLADALQRVGHNDQAEAIATRTLGALASVPAANARCHFTLGNVFRDRGETERAIEHLQIAAALSLTASDLELSSWVQLRLMVVLGELGGIQTAMARMDEVKQVLTRFGDARPFAGLHLWLVEVESMRGNLENARKHLNTADSLLSGVEDVWLRGYFAINKSALHYYSAEIPEAKRWAEIATDCAKESGHRATQRAAHANLGNIEFALGNHIRAEECFDVALRCCEPGSVHQIAILDNIAQIRLHAGQLDRCRDLISTLDALLERNSYAKRRHYKAYALQTKIRLLLREGKNREALAVKDVIANILSGLPQGRVGAETHLLNAEVLLANARGTAAVNALSNLFFAVNPLSADLLARFEHISGRT